ncbi:MobF family relaxase [Opitutus sp. ER46]|uniref:MobF family relaxase n=1 Tax=Opitutus sp. ER46 TaxID=2161864 RepID=UPI000D317FE4|nr:MobF family relaxase [Opitutus sp. ER46]PTX92329.1 hypothetical protein DB354_13380 [Opitutus sp. ER46]
MLRITQSESADAAKRYFDESLSRGDYYCDEQEIAGMWGGRGAERLGLEGRIDRDAFVALLENKKPEGTRLTARMVTNRRPGYDFTFDVPKSVSVLHALTRDDRIISAMQTAFRETLREMEEVMHARVRKSGAFSDRKTGNMIWAEFLHFTTRPTAMDKRTEAELLGMFPELNALRGEDGRVAIPDPHLHCHVYVVNATFDEVEEQWKAGEFMRIKRDAPYFQAAYHVRLAGELQRLGFNITPTADGFEVAGVPRSLCEVFSRRTKEIEALARELGITSGAAKDALGALTRRAKNPAIGMQQLREIWRGFLSQEESRQLEALAESALSNAPALERDSPDAASAAVRYALAHELERASVVSEKRLLARALMRAVGQVRVQTVRDEVDRTDELLRAVVDGENQVTTRDVLAEESTLMAIVRNGRGTVPPLFAQDYRFQNPLLGAETKDAEEQRRAIRHVLHSQDWIVGVIGRAGTGKTTLLHEIRAAMKARGQRMIACAPTAKAARGVLREEGLWDAETIAKLLADESRHAALRGALLWIDEAGMVGNRDMLALLRLARARGVERVVLAGDPSQIRSVSRGDPLAFLEKNAGLAVARLDRIKRQKTPELKAVVEAISRGNVGRGLKLLDRGGGIVESGAGKAWVQLAAEYVACVDQPKAHANSVLVVSPTHEEGAAVTAAIRQALVARGLLNPAERKIQRTVKLAWTEAEKGSVARYSPDLIVQFKQHVNGFRKSERVRVTEVDVRGGIVGVLKNDGTTRRLPVDQSRKFQVYELRDLPVAVGDMLRITENGFTEASPESRADLESGHRSKGTRVNNGDIVRVAGFTADGGLVLANGCQLPRDFGHVDHGYVVTADAAQSRTVDVVLAAIGEDSIAATDHRRVYVTLSRARYSARVFTENKGELMRAAQRTSERQSAYEVLGETRSRQILQQMTIREAQRAEARKRRMPGVTPRIPARSRTVEMEMSHE